MKKIILFTLAIMLTLTLMPISTQAAVKKPAKPVWSKCTSAQKSLTLRWKKAKNAKKYEVYQLKAKNYKKIKTLKAKKLTIKKLKPNVKYKFKIRGINGKKKSKFSSVKTLKTKKLTKKKIIKTNFVSFEKSDETIKVGKTIQTVLLFLPNKANDLSKIKLTSSNSAVASATVGSLNTRKGDWGKVYIKITGKKAGTTVITAAINGQKDSIDVAVNKPTSSKPDDTTIDDTNKIDTTENQNTNSTTDQNPVAKVPTGWTPQKGFSMFKSDYNGDLSAAFGFGNDACVLASIKYYKGVDKNSHALDRIRGVAEWMADNISYAVNPVDQGLDRATACAGYANYYKYLLETYFGVKVNVVTGFPDEESDHAWNVVKYNNKWYAVDVTWFDLGKNKYDFEYFMKSSHRLWELDHYALLWNSKITHTYDVYNEAKTRYAKYNYDMTFFTVATATDMDYYDWSKYGDDLGKNIPSVPYHTVYLSIENWSTNLIEKWSTM